MFNIENISRKPELSDATASTVIWCVLITTLALLVLSGCGFSGSATGASRPLVLSGTVNGGNQPVTGAEVQLYAVGLKGVASAAQPLLSSPVHTDGSGKFSLSTDYPCPSPSAPVYVVTHGGNPGLADGTNNAALTLTAIVGSCSAVSATPIAVNEVTTVGTVWPLAQYMRSPTDLGATANDSVFSTAVASVPEFIDVTQGKSPGTPAPGSYFADSAKLYSLANVLASCVNSAGGSAGDGSACGALFSVATTAGSQPPTDTMSAAILIAQNPGDEVNNIFSLVGAVAPFSPTLSTAPADWTLRLRYPVATPVISLVTGSYAGSQQVTISDGTAGSVLHFTTDGMTPTSASATYTGAISVASTTTIQAIAFVGESPSMVASSTLTIENPTASARLVFTGQPANAQVSAVLAPAVQVTVQDASGGTLANAVNPITLTLEGGSGLAGTLTVKPQNGIATFSSLTVSNAGAGYRLLANSPGLAPAQSASFSVSAPPAAPVAPVPAKLVFLQQPRSALAGATLTPAVEVAVEDTSGHVVANATNTVTLAMTTVTALGGSVTIAAKNGIAIFNNLSVDVTGSGYELLAASSGLTPAMSTPFNITAPTQAGAAVKLIFVQEPANGLIATPLSPAVQVAVEDSAGQVLANATNAITIRLTNGMGLGGALTVAPVDGIATFNNLTVGAAGGYTLVAASAGLSSATSTAFNITAAPVTPQAAKLAFLQQPVNTAAMAVMAPAVQVGVEDASGNLVTTAAGTITLSLQGGTGLGGTVSVAARNGIATFSNLSVSAVGVGYTLSAGGPGLSAATSNPFSITSPVIAPPVAAKLAFLQQPSNAVAMAVMTPPVQVAIEDASGNVVTTATASVTLGLVNATGLGGTLTVAAVKGIATFSGLTVSSASAGDSLSANSSGLAPALSNAFNITAPPTAPPAAVKLAFVQQPSNALTQAIITPAVQVAIEDAGGSVVSTATNQVTLTLGSGSGLGGTLTVAAVNGVATFSTLTVSSAGSGLSLSASSAGLTAANSSAFTISAPPLATNGTTILPSLPVNLTALPSGTFLITYNWQALPVSGQYSVFVNFVDSSGTVQFQDAVQPPAAPSVWNGPLTYTHTVTVPASAGVGTYTIVAGLQSASGNLSIVAGSGVTAMGNGEYQIGTMTLQPTCSITAFGAVGDGVTDNLAAIQNTFNYAATHSCIALIPAGTFAYSGMLTATGISVQGTGAGSILKPLSLTNAALSLVGRGGSITNLVMVSTATQRLSTPWSGMIWVNGAQNYYVDNVLIHGSSSIGIMSYSSSNGYVFNNTIANTLADGITQIVGSYDITVSGNRILNCGDDGVSNNSYVGSPMVHDIKVQGNTVLNNIGGRGLEVSGGTNISFTGNYVDNPDGYTDVYIASESEWSTLGVTNVTVTGNTLVAGGPNQGSAQIYNSQGATYSISGVNITANQFVNPLLVALQLTGNGSETGLTIENNTDYSNGTFGVLGTGTGTLSGNQVLSPSAFTTSLAPAGGGCSFTGC